MNIHKKLISSKQRSLFVMAILIAISIVTLLIAVQWYQKNNEYQNVLDGYSDKSAYESCLNKAKKIKTDNMYFQLIAKRECEKEWGLWKRIKKEAPSFQSFLLKDIDEILIVTLILAAGIYIIISTYVFYAKCNNMGWKRLAIIFAFIPSFVIALLVYNNVGSRISGEEYFQILLGAIAGYILAIFIILGGKQAVAWVKDGFNQSS